jgi:general secretion pathway protein A
VTTTAYSQLFSFFGLQQNPFNVSPDLRFLFTTPAYQSTLAELLFAVQNRQGLMLLTGEAGAGKTTLLQQLLDTLHRRGISSSYIFHSRLDSDDLFQFILEDFGVSCTSRRKADVLQVLHRWLVQRHRAGDTPVIIIDEAQVIPGATLDELRLLLNLESSNGKLVQIILAGQPELDEKLRRTELRQLRQRVMFRCRLPLLTLAETSAYIQSRLTSAGLNELQLFPPETISAIFDYSKGIPRTVNLIGEHALINAYAGQKCTVTPEDIRYIASDFDLIENPLSLNPGEPKEERGGVLRFPHFSPEPGSLSALRMAFVSQQSFGVNAPSPLGAALQSGPELVLEKAFPLPAQSEAAPVAIPTPASTEQRSEPSRKISEGTAPLKREAIAPDQPMASRPEPRNGSGATRSWHRAKNTSRFAEYWKDVADSFRRDARACYSEVTGMLAGKRINRNRTSPAR